jgi:steroid delta-isomerase-like uncharacterized protein
MEEVWNQQLSEKIKTYLTSDYTIHQDAGDPWEGKTLSQDDFKDRLQLSFVPFPDIHFKITTTIEEETCVAISWVMTGTNLGPISGFPPTGKSIRTTGMTFYHFEGSLISGHTQVFDRKLVMRQLGFA